MPRTEGVELIQRLHDGRLTQAEPEEVLKIRTLITQEIEEILEAGARVRPLYVGDQKIGWVRGVHLSERKVLKRYVFNRVEFTQHLLKLGTSLSPEFIKTLTAVELRSLLRVITEMTNSDLRLYPYITPFVTTNVSEQLWFSRGMDLTAFQRRQIILPDDSTLPLWAAPDHARLWATLASYRERAKTRLEHSMNALLIVRPWAGKGVDGLASDLRSTAKALLPDRLEPWSEVIKAPRPINLDDGWAHGEDDSREGIIRELDGMMNNDRHERVMKAFEDSLVAKAEAQQQEIDAKINQRGGPGFMEETKFEFGTASEIRKRVAEIRKNRKGVSVAESQRSQTTKLRRYQ